MVEPLRMQTPLFPAERLLGSAPSSIEKQGDPYSIAATRHWRDSYLKS